MSATATQPHCPIFRLAITAFVCSLFLGWLPLPPLRAQGAPPVFRAKTELVRLDVSVTDRQGRPVADVRPEEVQITENGRRCPVVLFRHVTDGSSLEGGEDAGGFREVSRNEAAGGGQLYVLVFDQTHMTPGRVQRARLAAERFLSNQLKPGDAVAIYGLPGPGPALGLTGDLILARARLRELHAQPSPTIGGLREFDAYRLTRSGHGPGDALDAALPLDLRGGAVPAGVDAGLIGGEVPREQATHVVAQADTRAQVFLGNLATVMRKLRVVEGRKTFVLFSEGFFVDNLATQMEQVACAAAQSHSIVYSIDLNTAQSSGEAVAMSAAELSERRDPLARLAAETNGRLVTNAGDLDRVLSHIAAETADYYLVGFEPSSAGGAQDYHRVKVNVTRPGAIVHARTGYSAAPASTPFAERQAIDVALTAPRTYAAIPIEYTTYERIGEHGDKPSIIASMTAHVPASRGAGGSADVVFVVRDAVTGQAVASGTDRAALPATADAAPGRLQPVDYAVQFDVPPGEYWMRMLVREPGGVLGTADRRFHVWPIDAASPATSDLIVTRLAGTRFDPPSQAVVRQDDDVLAYLEVYGVKSIAPADARVEVVRADQVVATADAIVKSGAHGETILRAKLPVAMLGDGQYTARVRVAPANQTPRWVMRTFRVVAAEPHSQQ